MDRIFHPWHKWECYKNGFYKSDNNYSKEKQIKLSSEIFLDIVWFDKLLKKLLTEWNNSCEHFLTSPGQNVVAWLGQAACAYAYRISNDISRLGYNELSDNEKCIANKVAEENYKFWVERKETEERQIGLWE